MKTPRPDERSQRQKFEDLARELEADEDEKRFENELRRIVKPPQPAPKKD